jgi:hypothetical protein
MKPVLARILLAAAVVRATRVSAAAAIAADAHAAFDGIFKGKLLNIRLTMRLLAEPHRRCLASWLFANGVRLLSKDRQIIDV